MARLTESEIAQLLEKLSGWERTGDALEGHFSFAGFADAVTFVVRVGFEAEAADHHPDVRINYKRVTLTYSTHSESGLTSKDFAGARAASAIAAAISSR
ncbi:MAG: 4a-hydroxytetrahydrobiopterin dehydratase [Acidobacteria bacterium]|nr:4a-hydroxytetrahydrobiopterin dehydratase [Acidobacteriota bacterium]